MPMEPDLEQEPLLTSPSIYSPATMYPNPYFAPRQYRSSDTLSPTSPRTVKDDAAVRAARQRAAASSPLSTSTPIVDLKGWLALDNGPDSPGHQYLGSDGRQYDRVNPSVSSNPNFLPSEMKRVNTPPLKSAMHERKTKSIYRGFFFDPRKLADLQKSQEALTDVQHSESLTPQPKTAAPKVSPV